MTESKDYAQQLRSDWARVGKIERARYSSCGICGCKSNEWETVGSTMLGIKTRLICPGKLAEPELHEKIAKKHSLLYDDALPANIQEEITHELKCLRALIQASR